jgi:hypothetical protein
VARFIKRKNGLYVVNKSITVIFPRREVAWVTRKMGVGVDQAIELMVDLVALRGEPSFHEEWIATEGNLTIGEIDPQTERIAEDGETCPADFIVKRASRK